MDLPAARMLLTLSALAPHSRGPVFSSVFTKGAAITGRKRTFSAVFKSWRAMLRRRSAAALVFFACSGPLLAGEPVRLVPDWLSEARIAGAELFSEMTAGEIAKNLKALADQNVTVIEADSDLSRLLTETEFEKEISLMRRYSEAAHQMGMKVVWYYPALEVLTPNAKATRISMYQTHPDWVQRGLDGRPNVFMGDKRHKKRVHWVDPGTESAWMSPHSGYADEFTGRVKRIAATGIDGIWLDVPIYNDIAVAWADSHPAAAAKFQADVGFPIPKAVDWNDPVWRRWVAWRHQEITSFVLRVRDAARSVANDIPIVVETVTLDYDAATMLGLDGTTMKQEAGLIQVWEADAVSDRTAMREAKPDDWISLIGMFKFAKGASGKKPSWMFTYGKEPDDALLVMAEALATGNHPYETKIPLMTTTVGPAYRKRMFSWIKREQQRLFESESLAKVAVYYSPESRDYLDKSAGSGLFASTKSKDPLWWSSEQEDSVYGRTYLAEYRGIIKWLANNHIPFDIIARPDAAELSRYQTIIAPSLGAIMDEDANLLDEYVAAGGDLIVTGPRPAMLDEFGNERQQAALKSLPLRQAAGAPDITSSVPGAKRVVHIPELQGKAYLASDLGVTGRSIDEAIAQYLHSPVSTTADKTVHIELRRSGNEIVLHLINPERIWNKKAPTSRMVTVSVEIPADAVVSAVQLTSPEPVKKLASRHLRATDAFAQAPATTRAGKRVSEKATKKSRPARSEATGSVPVSRRPKSKTAGQVNDDGPAKTASLPYQMDGNRVVIQVPLEAYEMVVISTTAR
jgi:hypothetical protein